MKLLIGYDGSECADVALNDLTRAGLPEKGEAVVLSVADVWPQVLQGDAAALSAGGGAADWAPINVGRARQRAREEVDQARVTADRGARRLESLLPGWEIRGEAEPDVPHWAIVKRADAWRPDMVVVGSHGRSALGRLFLGSVSNAVLTHARCSVRIARPGVGTEASPARILLGIDGSAGSAAAARVVEQRRWPRGTKVIVVTALDTAVSTSLPVGAAIAWQELRYEQDRDWVGEIVERVAGGLRHAGLEATNVVREGNPRKVLIDEAERWKADCIFVGAKGLSRLERFLIGSVSTAVASRAQCTVEVVREPVGA